MRITSIFVMLTVFSMKRKRKEKNTPTPIASSSKFLSKDMLQFIGNFLEPDSAQKMKETIKKWSNIKIYKNIFPNEYEVALFKIVRTGEIIWEAIKFTELRKPMRNHKILMPLLRRNDSEKWKDVFVWVAENRRELMKNKSQYNAFLKTLMLPIAENVAATFTSRFDWSPLMMAAAIDGTDSILTLIRRGADVHQQNNIGWTALHVAANYENMNACATLLKNNANIDATDYSRYTPLMIVAIHGEKQMFEFLIEKGANEYLINDGGKTALHLANFQQEYSPLAYYMKLFT